MSKLEVPPEEAVDDDAFRLSPALGRLFCAEDDMENGRSDVELEGVGVAAKEAYPFEDAGVP